MVGVYIAVAIGAVLVVSFFVDQIPKSLFTKSSDLKGDIVDLVLSTGNPLSPSPSPPSPSVRNAYVH